MLGAVTLWIMQLHCVIQNQIQILNHAESLTKSAQSYTKCLLAIYLFSSSDVTQQVRK